MRIAAAAILLAALLPGQPARADDDVLGQIENQVASIVEHTTAGIVTVEDLRGIEQEDNWRESFRQGRRGLRHQLIDALNRLSDAEIQIAVLKGTGKPDQTLLAQAAKSRSSILGEIDTLRADLAKNPDISRLNVDIAQGHLDSLNLKRTHLDAEIAQLGKPQKPAAPKLAALLAARGSVNSQIAEYQTILASDRQKLQSDPMMRTDIPKAGTGFSIGSGLIVTTADVLDGMSEPIIITTDGSRIRTRIVGVDNETNIGLLHMNGGPELPALTFADSDTVKVGHFAISIGNQAGSNNTVALNTISGIRSDGMFSGRRFYPRLLQVAGTIAPGNSGAPLLNSHGDVIGMVVAVPVSDLGQGSGFGGRLSGPQPGPVPSPGGQPGDAHRGPPRSDPPPFTFTRTAVTSVGYAMPINAARPIIADLESGKAAQHCWIGISVAAQVTHSYNDSTLNLIRTVTVNGVYPDSPALKAGVQKGDEIVSINGRPIREEVDVRIVSMLARPGDAITIVVNRPNGQRSENLTLHAAADLRPKTFPRPIPTRAP